MLKKLLLVFFVTFSTVLVSQVTMSGKVYDEYLEPFPNALINSLQGKTTSDIDGNFTLKLKSKLPFSIQVSAFGYKTELLEITSEDQEINIILKENTSLDEVVISASRSPERVIESPVTIERLGINDIKKGTSISFYDGVTNLKGITSREASYGFKSVNSRGFSSFDNTRFVQLVDGVETSIPALNFSAGNIVGLSELDVKDVEILPGASSALYGANAFNGILLMRSKNPFKYDGISTYFKTGFIEQEQSGSDQFYDVGIRMAHKFSDYFAAKVNLTVYKAEEWHANDDSNTTGVGGEIIAGNRNNTPDYDGVNFYGDEATFTFPGIGKVSRTGYAETDLYDYDGYGLKFDGSLHFRPMGNDKLEIVYNSRFSKGNNLYQAVNRFSQEDYYVEQHKLEVLGKNFFVRGYFNGNDGGDRTHDVRFLGLALNSKYNDNRTWFGEYGTAFAGGVPGVTPGNDASARAFADRNRLQPGTAAFNQALDEAVTTPISQGGAGVKDETSFYHADANYNFRDLIKWGEIQIGGSYRKFNINSQGTLFTDENSPIEFDMYGVYSQIQKKFLDERLKFTGSVRYDKSSNFEGDFSPRVALNYSIKENKILRISYQTGFRTPSTIEQYFGLRSGPNKFLLGTSLDNIERFSAQVLNNDGTTNTITGAQVFEKAFVLDNGAYVNVTPTAIKPERVSSYELGYRSIVNITDTNILELDVNGYYNQYENFVATKNVIVPNYGNTILTGPLGSPVDATEFALNSNTTADVQSYGIGIGLNTKLFRTFNFGANYTLSKLVFDQEEDVEFEPGFNTPEHQVKVMFGNENLFNNFGFNVNARWQNEFLWQSGFLSGNVDSRTVLDAQINYRIPSLKSRIKVGGTNLTRKEYVVAPGSGLIGSMYYVSWTIND
ncbi:TonB-dependent receptor [Tenacibaculum haliotis]|uniref:TonB-dependent receptor n=1 Tax=Tenacibaculum haliotis TaxID=1888914 RepID=UPI0021AF36D7|nr:TonB-dependent receptor [Tenacibaculum haliotis]MCT4699959.1 TonB-dependent receptor [Tenacibaculum haliotis]